MISYSLFVTDDQVFAHQNGGPVTNQKINIGSRLQLDSYDTINFILNSY